uniref:Nucleoprotein n=1 Tax=Retropinna hantavirus TaxID=3064110 RepID=A0AA49X4J4_9VIRU|nr:MAG: nucleoprotein [Retropinna hantavirus]
MATAPDPVTSSLAFGGIVNLDALDFAAAAGEKADWTMICNQLRGVETKLLGKAWYQLNIRGKQEKKTRLSQRVCYSGTNSATGAMEKIYVSFPNAQTSVKAGELTSARYSAAVAGHVSPWMLANKHTPILTAVTGGNEIFEKWVQVMQRMTAWFGSTEGAPIWTETCGAKEAGFNGSPYIDEWAAMGDKDTKAFRFPIDADKSVERQGAMWNDTAPYIIAASPGMPPLGLEWSTGMVEGGVLFASMSDFRERMKVSLNPNATSDERDKARLTAFASSYSRRSGQRGHRTHPLILAALYQASKEQWLEGMSLGNEKVGGLEVIWNDFFTNSSRKWGSTGAKIEL